MSTHENDSTLAQLIRYGIVGGIALVADVGCLLLLTEVFGIHYLWSAAAAFVVGLLVNYALSIRWVFHHHTLSSRTAEFLIFGAIGLIGLAFNELILWSLTEHAHLWYPFSKGAATLVVFAWNFFARKMVLFSRTPAVMPDVGG